MLLKLLQNMQSLGVVFNVFCFGLIVYTHKSEIVNGSVHFENFRVGFFRVDI